MSAWTRRGAFSCFGGQDVYTVDADVSAVSRDEVGHEFHDAYGRLCGRLSLEDMFTTDSVYAAAQRASVGFRDKRDT